MVEENPEPPRSYAIINRYGTISLFIEYACYEISLFYFCSNFTRNVDPGGVVNLGFNNAGFYGVNKFEGNIGPSLRVILL